MAEGRGYAGLCGGGVESAWGTEVIVTQRVPILSEDFDEQYDQVADASLEGQRTQRLADQGMLNIPGTLVTGFRYLAQNVLLSQFFGSLTLDTPTNFNTYAMVESSTGISRTLAIEQQVSVKTLTGFKTSTLTIAGSVGNTENPVTLSYAGAARAITRASATNTTAVLAALTEATGNLLFTDLTFRIGDLADALASGDDFGISDFSLNLNRNLLLDQHTNQQRNIIEPVENAFSTGVLAFTLPRYTANTFKAWQLAQTPLQARLFFTDGTASKEFLLPEMLITDAPANTSGAELLNVPITLALHRRQTNVVAGMSTIAGEIQLIESA